MSLIDSHCHLDLILQTDADSTLDTILDEARDQGVSHLITIATTLENCEALLEMTQSRPEISCSCGVHPLSAGEAPELERLQALAQREKVVAIGETGLDYSREETPIRAQQAAFCAHIYAAIQLNKPLVIHTRAAGLETLDFVKREGADRARGVIHCFTETKEFARNALDLGLFISFSGIITFKNSKTLQEIARYVPLVSTLIETDAPYLAPIPYRGKTNRPAYVREVARLLANLHQTPLERVAEQTTFNAKQLFGLPTALPGTASA